MKKSKRLAITSSLILAGINLLFVWGTFKPHPLAAADNNVVINEIHYDPALKTEFSEFIELYNPGATAVDLSGWTLSGGVAYTFTNGAQIAAGGYLILAQTDPNLPYTISFQDRFGFASFGEFQGKLKNEGEELTLRNALGDKIDGVVYEGEFPWPVSGEGQSIELIHPTLDNLASGNWRSGGPTPGAQNSVFASNAAPDIRKVGHNPQQPTSTEAVTITAKVTDPHGIGAVSLFYQLVNPGSYIALNDAAYATDWTALSMFDDGSHGDATAADDIYTVVLPVGFQQHRGLVRYRIGAVDTLNATVLVPYADDPQPNFAYFVYDGVPNWSGAINPAAGGALGTVVNYNFNTMQNVSVYQFIAKSSDIDAAMFASPRGEGYTGSEYKWQGTLIYDGLVYDHIGFRARGGVHRYRMGKQMWKFDFKRSHEFQARDNYGRKYEIKWDKLNFSAIIQQGDFGHRGEQGLFEAVSFKLFNLAGVESPYTHFVHFRVIDNTLESDPATQYEGDFWGLYLAVEQPDGNFLEAHNLPDGNLYKMENWTGTLNNQGDTAATNRSDLDSFMNAYGRYKLTSPTDTNHNGLQQDNEIWWRTNMDLERYYSYRSVLESVHHYDTGYGKNYFFYLNPETQLWSTLPWDLDLSWDDLMYGDGKEPFIYRVAQNPDIPIFTIEYQNRQREVLDLLYNTEQTYQLIDEYMSKVNDLSGAVSIVDADRAMWDYNPIMSSNYVCCNKAGTGRYYQASTDKTFESMVGHSKEYVAYRSNWIISNVLTDEPLIPQTPTISYNGAAAFPVNKIRLQTTAFNDPQGDSFAALEWRIGEISYPGIVGHDATKPWIYEITAVWESGPLTSFNNTIAIDPGILAIGHTYRARVRMQDNTGRWSHWSAPLQFTTTTPEPFPAGALIISELHYNPPGEDDALEFIELKNTSNQTLDLSAVTVAGVGDYAFPINTTIAPQQFIVLARYPALFTAHYGFTPFNMVGYSGSLQNSGEKVSLFDSGGITITTFVYNDKVPWPTAADGDGYSLVPRNPNNNPNPADAANWRASTSLGGSPSQDDPTLSIADIAITEQNTNTTAEFIVTLSATTGQGITTTFAYASSNATAKASTDYLAVTGSGSIIHGQTSQKISVTIIGDMMYESAEQFYLNLSENSGLTDSQAVVTITDNDTLPTIAIVDSTTIESQTAILTVTLSAPSGVTTMVHYNTQDMIATAGQDYTAAFGTLTFAPGITTRTVALNILNDAVNEAPETMRVLLSNPVNATLADTEAELLIIDDDGAPSLTITGGSLIEGNNGTAVLNFTVTLAPQSDYTATVSYHTADGSATAGSDYVAKSGALTFAPGETTKTISIIINGDTLFEDDETFNIALTNPQNATLAVASASGSIINDDHISPSSSYPVYIPLVTRP